MSKLPKLLPRRSLFADDFMIYTESSITRSDLVQSNLQTSDDLTIFISDHRINLSGTKSVRVLFERKKSNRLKPQDVTTVRSSLLRNLLSSLALPWTLLSLPYCRHSCPSSPPKIELYLLSNLWPLYLLSSIRSLFDYGIPATCAIQLSWARIQTHFISRALSIPSFILNDRKRQHVGEKSEGPQHIPDKNIEYS